MPKKFYILPQFIKSNKIYLSGKEVHYIRNVLRYGDKDQILFFDNSGKEYLSQIETISPQKLVAAVVEIRNHPSVRNMEITLAQALPKLNKFDWVVQKATELGVGKIIPLKSQRSLVNLDSAKEEKKKQRWQKITQEACQQCGRGDIPQIESPQPLKSVLDSVKDYNLSLFFSLGSQSKPLKEVLKSYNHPKKILIFIGPEGDFSPEEISWAKERDIPLASLGDLVLKAETAAITVLSILNYEYN